MIILKLLLLWVALSSAIQQSQQTTPIVRVRSGQVQGIVSHSILYGDYYSYLGIPYATVKNRFQASEPVQPWDGVFKAQNSIVQCTQNLGWLSAILPLVSGVASDQEDCLILNVFNRVPEENKQTNTLKPVMVFIHGGAFKSGSSSPFVYGPEYFIRYDVILVTINYRLDSLGFMCLGIKEAPGNVGLKDQVEALKWVKENINAFGGDPDSVTIFGESAGSASIMYHLLSPMSKGLFKQAIMQSGSAASLWGFQFEPLKIASELAKAMGQNIEDPYELYNFFMNKTNEELVSTQVPRTKGSTLLFEYVFAPCAEKEFPGIPAFLTDTPYNTILKGQIADVPLIIGYNSAEGYFFLGADNSTTKNEINFLKSLPTDLKFPTNEEEQETADRLQKLYIGSENDSKDEYLVKLAQFVGESGISYPVTASAQMFLKRKNKPVYIYRFSYSGLLNLIKLQSGFATKPGATHADDILYMFKPKLTAIGGLIENEIINKMTTMWTNFAKYGNPTPSETSLLPLKWQAANKEDPYLMVIDRQFSVSPLWDSETFKVWDEIYSKYRREQYLNTEI